MAVILTYLMAHSQSLRETIARQSEYQWRDPHAGICVGSQIQLPNIGSPEYSVQLEHRFHNGRGSLDILSPPDILISLTKNTSIHLLFSFESSPSAVKEQQSSPITPIHQQPSTPTTQVHKIQTTKPIMSPIRPVSG
jgi:hypothetical protein